MKCVAQQVVKYPGELVRVAIVLQPIGQREGTGQPLFRELGLKLAGHLPEHQSQVHWLLLQLQVGEVEAGDVEKLVDQLLQPFRLVQGDVGVPRAQLQGDLRLVPEQGEVANDAGQGCFQIVG